MSCYFNCKFQLFLMSMLFCFSFQNDGTDLYPKLHASTSESSSVTLQPKLHRAALSVQIIFEIVLASAQKLVPAFRAIFYGFDVIYTLRRSMLIVPN